MVSKNGVLDVHSTSNLKNEMLSYQRYLSYAKNGVVVKDGKVKSKVSKLSRMIKENGDLTFVIYLYSQDLGERLLVEAAIAYQNGCKYWVMKRSHLPIMLKKFESLEKRERKNPCL